MQALPHPAFLGYFGSTSNGPALLGEIVAAALNVSAMTWRTSPAATEMETVVLRWIQELVGIPQPAANEMVGAYSAFYRPLLPDRNSGMPGSTKSVRASILR